MGFGLFFGEHFDQAKEDVGFVGDFVGLLDEVLPKCGEGLGIVFVGERMEINLVPKPTTFFSGRSMNLGCIECALFWCGVILLYRGFHGNALALQ